MGCPVGPKGTTPSAPDRPKLAGRVSAHSGNGMCPSREQNPSGGLQPAIHVTPSPLTPGFGSDGTETMGPNGARIGVPAAWHRPQKSSISDVRTRAKLSLTPMVHPSPKGSRSGTPTTTATMVREPANPQRARDWSRVGKPRSWGERMSLVRFVAASHGEFVGVDGGWTLSRMIRMSFSVRIETMLNRLCSVSISIVRDGPLSSSTVKRYVALLGYTS